MNAIIISEYFIVQDAINQLLYKNFNIEEIKNLKELNSFKELNLMNYELLIINMDYEDDKIISLVRSIKNNYRNIQIIMLNFKSNLNLALEYIQSGIDAYLLNIKEKDEFIYAIRKVLEGKKYFDSSLLEKILNDSTKNRALDLTDRETQILEEVSKGLSNKEIASILYLSEYTVKKHISNILKKLKLKSRRDLMIYALKNRTS
ncbi:two component transcriptional regulator, LuxR family [Clostridium collagenovorans DSM 3089]|uniref:Two component transcriptional regulator, LuxR family n=1 Tax=Clostridium collagenovorans DSM 3089 TaxID=1121306 RepID=A0A1M5YA67_9CLOT|nr:response regulator transcription factor [Clostridium collagenovorans]SHI08937.1 two component transcriptional regulator, LuxR family [Clostridium collagenovorans DSM 3089]